MKERYIVGKSNEVLHLSILILKAFYNHELILVVIHGRQGYGKSTYASIVKAQVYSIHTIVEQHFEKKPHLLEGKTETQIRREKLKLLDIIIDNDITFDYDWKQTKKFFVFTPRQFLTLSRKQKQKTPCICVDDAGLWLNAMDYQNPLVKAVGKFFEVARTKWGAILFTCSDLKQIFTKIRNMPHVFTIRITKAGADKEHPERRTAMIYEGWTSEDLKKSGRKAKYVDIYYAEMPTVFYSWYNPEREMLADMGLNEIEEILDKLNIDK